MRGRQLLVFGLLLAGVVLGLICVNAEAELVRRGATCAGPLVFSSGTEGLPAIVYALGVIGVLAGLAALILLGRWFGRQRRPIVTVLFVTGVAGLVFEVFALISVFDTPPVAVCG